MDNPSPSYPLRGIGGNMMMRWIYDVTETSGTWTRTGGTDTKSATYAEGDGPKLYVLSQGVQAAGFDDAATALNTAFGEVTAVNAQAWFKAVAGN